MLTLTVLAAAGVVALTVLLLADATAARRRAPTDEMLVEALEGRVRTHAGAAAVLEAERKRQTETSLAREAANRRLGWLLLVASALFLTGAKWLRGEQERRPGAVLVQLNPVGRFAGFPTLAEAEPEGAWRGPLHETSEPGIDLGVVDELVAGHGRGREAVIPILQAIQAHYRYLPEEALRRLAELSEITPAQIAGVASFYARFRSAPMGEHLVRVCHGTACHVAGARHVDDELRRRFAIPPGADTDPGRRFTLEPVACVGCCSLAPVIVIGDETAGRLTPATAGERLAATVLGSPRSGATEQA